MSRRVFLSYRLEDRWARDALVEAALGSSLTLVEYPPTPLDDEENWEVKVQELLSTTEETIVLVGPTTASSEPVRWEVARSRDLRHRVRAILLPGMEEDSGFGPPSETLEWSSDIADRIREG
jgi:hypothetical protein